MSLLKQSEQVAEQPRHLLSVVKIKPLRHEVQTFALIHTLQFLIQFVQVWFPLSKYLPGGHYKQLVALLTHLIHCALHNKHLDDDK